MSLYCKISFEIDQLSIILIVIGFCCYGNIYFKCDTVWMNCNIQQTVSVLKLVSNALFRLQKQQAGFAGGSQSTSERELLKQLLRETLPAKKKQFERLRGGHSGLNQGVRPSYYNLCGIVAQEPHLFVLHSTVRWAQNREHSCVVVFIIFIKYFIFMFFDIGRRRVLIIVKYIIIMKKMQPLDGTVTRISDVTCFENGNFQWLARKKMIFQLPCHHSALLGTIPHFFRHFCVLIGQPVSP